jgi:hypothetical protein
MPNFMARTCRSADHHCSKLEMVQINAGNLLTHRIAVVFNVQNSRKTPKVVSGTFFTFHSHILYLYPSILFLIFGYEKAWAQGFRPRTQGSGSGLQSLKPEPAQAEPKPGHSGRAGPATSLYVVKHGQERSLTVTPTSPSPLRTHHNGHARECLICILRKTTKEELIGSEVDTYRCDKLRDY